MRLFSRLPIPRLMLSALAVVAGLGGPVRAVAAEGPPPPAGCSGPASATWLKVVAEGVRSASGTVAVTLYADDPGRFLAHHGALYVGHIPATPGTAAGCIFIPKPGVYVLALYHDENNNGTFDRTSVGLPAEGYGFSNNPPTLLGLPSFRSVRLDIGRSGMAAHVRLTYP